MTDKQRFSSVWDAIEDTPKQAASMRALSESRMNLAEVIGDSHKTNTTTTEVTLRLDTDLVDKFRASGEGWQTRINDALKSWVQTHA